jgi:hypothetical protein
LAVLTKNIRIFFGWSSWWIMIFNFSHLKLSLR